MKHLIVVLIVFSFIRCSNKVSKEQLEQLNGYWEITEVNFTNGQKKQYIVNQSIDYIELQGMKGFKKKVSPKLDGSYDTSNDAENFTIVEKDGGFLFSYKNKLAQWEDKITAIEANGFSISNEANISYTYKRYEPIKIE